MQVAIPEFDGRLIDGPVLVQGDRPGDGLPVYVADPERAARVAGLAVRHARLRRTPNSGQEDRASCSPRTRPSTPASATRSAWTRPASAVRAAEGACGTRATTVGEFPEDSDALIHTLIAAGGHDVEWLTEDQLAAAPARVPLTRLPASGSPSCRRRCATACCDALGRAARGRSTSTGRHRARVPAVRQRGADDPAAARVRREPDRDLPRPRPAAVAPLPGRLPLARAHASGADAVIHLGKHGTLEWLPGKGLGLSAGCAPDAVLGDLPLVYPFIVNDPGEGTQAKRRGHATVVDHLVPPMARADTYGEMAKLEQLLDEYATVAALDPAKLPALRGADLGGRHGRPAAPRPARGRRAGRGGLRRLRPARRRLPVRGQGRPDPRRAAHPGRSARRRGAGQPGAGRAARQPDLGRRGRRVPGLRAALAAGRGSTSRRCWRSRAGPIADVPASASSLATVGPRRDLVPADDRRPTSSTCWSRSPAAW